MKLSSPIQEENYESRAWALLKVPKPHKNDRVSCGMVHKVHCTTLSEVAEVSTDVLTLTHPRQPHPIDTVICLTLKYSQQGGSDFNDKN